jgi:hypothetical protein
MREKISARFVSRITHYASNFFADYFLRARIPRLGDNFLLVGTEFRSILN